MDLLDAARFAEAVESCGRALERHPGHVYITAARAVALARLGREQDAADAFEGLASLCARALEADAGDVGAAEHLARALHYLNRYGEAAEAAERAAAAGSSGPECTWCGAAR